MKILFIHPNMPGQFKHLAPALARDPENVVVFLTRPTRVELPGVHKVQYRVSRDAVAETHRYLIPLERAVLRGQEVWRAARALRDASFTPDVIVGHLGWGEGLFLKDLFADTPVLSLREFYYDAAGGETAFLTGSLPPPDERARIRMKNATHLLDLESCDWGVSPTRFQRDCHPREFHGKISVIHDGIDTEAVRPDGDRVLELDDGTLLSHADDVVTYVARGFEDYRGFTSFMRAVEIIQRERPACHVVAVGTDRVHYGRRSQGGPPLRHQLIRELDLDRTRLHFTGRLTHARMVEVLQVSSVHVYLTVPFVLSWSLLEAMAAACVVVGSRTAPVEEVITDGQNGFLVDFHSPERIASKVIDVLEQRAVTREMGAAARATVERRYALRRVLPLHVGLISDLAGRRVPPPTDQRIREFGMTS